jgi:hypothetical protein
VFRNVGTEIQRPGIPPPPQKKYNKETRRFHAVQRELDARIQVSEL